MTNNGYTLEMSRTSAPLTGTYNGSLLLFGVRSLQKLYLACSLYRHCAPGHKLFTDICAIIDSGNLIRDNTKFSVKLVEEELKKTYILSKIKQINEKHQEKYNKILGKNYFKNRINFFLSVLIVIYL